MLLHFIFENYFIFEYQYSYVRRVLWKIFKGYDDLYSSLLLKL